MSASKLYTERISSLHNGLAIFNPHPSYDGDAKPLPRVRPGDVGYIDAGCFVRLFNLHQGEDDENGLPDGFQRLELRTSDIRADRFRPETIVSAKHWGISGQSRVATPSPGGAELTLASGNVQGAALQFFEPGWRDDARIRDKYKNAIIENGLQWLETAQLYDRDLSAERLILVTGCDRVRSWVIMIDEEDEELEGSLTLSVEAALQNGINVSSRVAWEDIEGVTVRYGPSRRLIRQPKLDVQAPATSKPEPSREPTVDDVKEWSDQCIFVRGYRLKWRRRLEKGGVREKGDELEAEELISGFLSEETPVTHDHMHQVLDHILDNSNADIALAHEEDILEWAINVNLTTSSARGVYLTADRILAACLPRISVSEYKGIKIGVILNGVDEVHRSPR